MKNITIRLSSMLCDLIRSRWNVFPVLEPSSTTVVLVCTRLTAHPPKKGKERERERFSDHWEKTRERSKLQGKKEKRVRKKRQWKVTYYYFSYYYYYYNYFFMTHRFSEWEGKKAKKKLGSGHRCWPVEEEKVNGGVQPDKPTIVCSAPISLIFTWKAAEREENKNK